MTYYSDELQEGVYGNVRFKDSKAIKYFKETECSGINESIPKEIVFYTYFDYKTEFKVVDGNEIILEMKRGYADAYDYFEHKYTLKYIPNIMRQLLTELYHIHNSGFLHRDIKLANILCFLEGKEIKYKFIDFGVSSEIDNEISYEYDTPLVYENEKYTTKTDLCQLGAVLSGLILKKCCPYVSKNISFLEKLKKNVDSKYVRYIDVVLNLIDKDPLKRKNPETILFETFNVKVKERKSCVSKSETVLEIPKEIYDNIIFYKPNTKSKVLLYALQMYERIKHKISGSIGGVFNACVVLCSKMFTAKFIEVNNPYSLYNLEVKILKALNFKFPHTQIVGDYDLLLTNIIKSYKDKSEDK